jgi:stage III sporulation protein AE
MKRRFLFFLCLLCFLFPASISWGAEAPAKEQETEVTQGLDLDQYDLSDLQKFLDQRNDNQGLNLSFQDLMKSLMDGKLNDVLSQTGKALKKMLMGEIESSGHMMGQILVLGIIGAVFSNFSSVFTGSQISETGFFVTYLLLFTYLAASFFTSISIVSGVVNQILGFMRVLMPAYFLAAAFAGSSATAVASYEFTLVILSASQWLLGTVLLSLIRVYALLVMAGHIAKEDMLSKLTELRAGGFLELKNFNRTGPGVSDDPVHGASLCGFLKDRSPAEAGGRDSRYWTGGQLCGPDGIRLWCTD